MARQEGQKLKLLYIIKMLQEFSDEKHPLTTKDIIDRLERENIHSERKSIYDDIEKLKDFGYDIIQLQSRVGGGYYLGDRDFEMPELKLMVDAVQSSRFITPGKSRDLIKKIEKLAGTYNASRLQRNVFVANRVKTGNEMIYYSIDRLYEAIQDNKQVSFDYLEWSLDKKLVPRDGGPRVVSPWQMVWQADNYYLVAYENSTQMVKHYRVDKIQHVEFVDAAREGQEIFDKIDLAEYAGSNFSMYAGEKQMVTLRFPNKLIGVVIDRFGSKVDVRPVGKECFRIRTEVAVSPQFFGWLAGLGSEAELIAPENVRSDYKQWIMRIMDSLQ